MEYSFTTYNIFKLHLPLSRQYVGILEKNNDFLALQEWVDSLHIAKNKHITTKETFTIPIRREKTGTATISSFSPKSTETLLSLGKELGFTTKKSAIITTYDLHGTNLTIFNCHSLNFVNNNRWKDTIDYWIEKIPSSGACIVAGDWNTWNPWRFNHLEKKLQKAGFSYANYDYNMIMRLDHIWHRNINPISCYSHIDAHTSDHYPVTLKFKLL